MIGISKAVVIGNRISGIRSSGAIGIGIWIRGAYFTADPSPTLSVEGVQLLDIFVRDCALEGIRVGDATSSPTVVIKKAVLVGNVVMENDNDGILLHETSSKVTCLDNVCGNNANTGTTGKRIKVLCAGTDLLEGQSFLYIDSAYGVMRLFTAGSGGWVRV